MDSKPLVSYNTQWVNNLFCIMSSKLLSLYHILYTFWMLQSDYVGYETGNYFQTEHKINEEMVTRQMNGVNRKTDFHCASDI